MPRRAEAGWYKAWYVCWKSKCCICEEWPQGRPGQHVVSAPQKGLIACQSEPGRVGTHSSFARLGGVYKAAPEALATNSSHLVSIDHCLDHTNFSRTSETIDLRCSHQFLQVERIVEQNVYLASRQVCLETDQHRAQRWVNALLRQAICFYAQLMQLT